MIGLSKTTILILSKLCYTKDHIVGCLEEIHIVLVLEYERFALDCNNTTCKTQVWEVFTSLNKIKHVCSLEGK